MGYTSIIKGDGTILTPSTITGKKLGVFAYLTAPAVSTIVTAGTYVPIAGTFSNAPMEGFSFSATPAIKYNHTLTQYFKIEWYASLKSDKSATQVSLSIKKDGLLLIGATMTQVCKQIGDLYTLAGTAVVELAQNGEIQLVLTCDKDNTNITIDTFTTTIHEFFD